MLLAPAAVTLAVTLCGLTGSSYWRDEAATVSATGQPLPGLLRLLGHVDAVHGLYYLLVWPFGGAEDVLRLPSVAAMTAAAFGVTLIGRRLRSRRAGLLSGLAFAVMPLVSLWGQHAQSYAMVTAAAVLASYLLLVAAERPRRFAAYTAYTAYGASIALLGYLNLFGLLILPAHAITMIVLSRGARRLVRDWAIAAAAGAIAVTPIAVLGWQQRVQISWLPAPAWSDVRGLVLTMLGGSALSAAALVALGVLGSLRGDWPAFRRPTLEPTRGAMTAWLCVPWLVLPPAILLIASEWVHVYVFTYVVFCVPAVALLAGSGLAALPAPGWCAALGLIIMFTLPAQLAARQPDGHGDNIRGAAQVLAAHARSSDALICWSGSWTASGGAPDWAYAYPYGFTKPRGIGVAQTPAQAANLFGRAVPLGVLEQRIGQIGPGGRVWVAELGTLRNRRPFILRRRQFRLAGTWHISDMWLLLYQRS
jgi:mannosyltransferase